MKKRILSILCSMIVLGVITTVSAVDVNAAENEEKIVDGSILTHDDSSAGCSTSSIVRGQYLMTGDCTISKAGLTRVYAYASTTANTEVNYIATLVYVEQYDETDNEWGYVDGWVEEIHNEYFLSTAKSIKVDRGYYYRVRANHLAGNQAPYDETASFTNGIYLP